MELKEKFLSSAVIDDLNALMSDKKNYLVIVYQVQDAYVEFYYLVHTEISHEKCCYLSHIIIMFITNYDKQKMFLIQVQKTKVLS